MRACLRAAHSSIRSFGMPSATALAMPPISSMSLMNYTKKKKHRSEQNDSMMRDYNTTTFIFVDDVYLTKTAPDTKVVKRFAFAAVLAVCHD